MIEQAHLLCHIQHCSGEMVSTAAFECHIKSLIHYNTFCLKLGLDFLENA